MRQFHLWTIGCQMNKAESWHIARLLAAAGYEESPRLDGADLVVLNTCVVRQSAEERIVGTLGLLEGVKRRRPEMRIAVTGCFAARDRSALHAEYPHVDLFFESGDYAALSRWLGSSEATESAQAARTRPCDSRDSAPGEACDEEGSSDIAAYVPIIQGCNNFCAYCIVPYRRGREKSRPLDEVVCEVRELVKRGTREVTLLGQNVDSYGHDLPDKPDLARLLEELQPIDGLWRIRFLTNHPKDMSERLIDAMARLDKVCEAINLPAQAGSDEVLKAMRRGYTAAEYRNLIARIRENVPGVALSNDIIVGFPGETEAQFEESAALLTDLRFDAVHIAAYSPRPGTIAARELKDDVPQAEKKRRLQVLEKLQEGIASEINGALAGKDVEVLVEGRQKGKWFGRTRTDKLVFFAANGNWQSKRVIVNVERASPWSLQGSVSE